ncbi:MAG: sodium/glutamate symporter [Cardiobacteriaceae bacterium]|nr:sodium/glutamate symporter [Cardiobacteriaceae bacterium]
MNLQLDFYATLLALVGVLLLGRFIISKSEFLSYYNIPEPVVGGIIVAVILFCLSKFGDISFGFESAMKDPLLLSFYSSIGLSADFSSFKKGGRVLIGFLIIVSILLFFQNLVAVGAAMAMGQNPALGLLGGSITMSGGHGTGAAWADTFVKAPYNFAASNEAAMAAATFGLVMGGIIGGPVAAYLIKKHNLKQNHLQNKAEETVFEDPERERRITAITFVESLALIATCLFIGTKLAAWVNSFGFKTTLPTFVYCLLVGAILRNGLNFSGIHKVFDREISVLGNVSLSLFLAFTLMTLNLAQLAAIALPMTIILILQVVMMIFFAIFITFRFCGRDYDAAVLSAGHCGFGLGATPTAIANMQTVTAHHGMSHMAFIVVPLVGAFFIDLVNAIVISIFAQLPLW